MGSKDTLCLKIFSVAEMGELVVAVAIQCETCVMICVMVLQEMRKGTNLLAVEFLTLAESTKSTSFVNKIYGKVKYSIVNAI